MTELNSFNSDQFEEKFGDKSGDKSELTYYESPTESPLSLTQQSRQATPSQPENLIHEVVETVTDSYTRTSDWISENLGGRNLPVVGLIVFAGVLGFLVGRRRPRTHSFGNLQSY